MVVPLRSESTQAIVSACMQVFTPFGTPQRIISDNGLQFSSAEFATACTNWAVFHKRIVPYTPRQNPVERLHQTLKAHMRKLGLPSAEAALRVALQAIRSTINTGRTPGDLLLKGGYNTPLRSLRGPKAPQQTTEEEEEDDEVRITDATAKSTAKTVYDAKHRAIEQVGVRHHAGVRPSSLRQK